MKLYRMDYDTSGNILLGLCYGMICGSLFLTVLSLVTYNIACAVINGGSFLVFYICASALINNDKNKRKFL